MKLAYPIVMTQGKTHIVVYIPDFDISTQGKDVAEAMEMSRDAIGVMGIDMEDDGEALPTPTALAALSAQGDEMVSLVDVDFAEYRRKNEMRVVKKNCTIPSWLNYEAEKANMNFSFVLQTALKEQLHLQDR